MFGLTNDCVHIGVDKSDFDNEIVNDVASDLDSIFSYSDINNTKVIVLYTDM